MPKAKAAAEPAEPVLDSNGQMLLHLGGGSYVLRPSWKAVQAIERQLRPLMQLAQDAAVASLSIDDMALITCEMMRAYGEANPAEPGIANYTGCTAENLAPLIFEAGEVKICARIMFVLSGAVNGGYTASGEVRAATKTSGATAAP